MCWSWIQDYKLNSRHFALSVFISLAFCQGNISKLTSSFDFISLARLDNLHCGIWLWFALNLSFARARISEVSTASPGCLTAVVSQLDCFTASFIGCFTASSAVVSRKRIGIGFCHLIWVYFALAFLELIALIFFLISTSCAPHRIAASALQWEGFAWFSFGLLILHNHLVWLLWAPRWIDWLGLSHWSRAEPCFVDFLKSCQVQTPHRISTVWTLVVNQWTLQLQLEKHHLKGPTEVRHQHLVPVPKVHHGFSL